MTLHKIYKGLVEVMIASKRPFDEFGVGVRMAKELTRVAVGIL